MPVNETSKANLIPFVKGDKRINRKGRITNFAQLRKLAIEIGNEAIDEEGAITRFKALLRVMSSSRNPADRKTYLEYAVGKVKDTVEIEGGEKPLKVLIEYSQGNTPPATPSAADDQGGA